MPGIQVNKLDHRGRTPLHKAAIYSSGIIVYILLGIKGIKVKEEGDRGRTPYDYAKRRRNQDIIDLLRKAEEELAETTDAAMEICDAIDRNSMADLERLLEQHSGNDEVLGFQNAALELLPPLFEACECDNLPAVRLLVSTVGVDINQVSEETGTTVLMEAARHGLSGIVQYLLTVKEIDLNARALFGEYKGLSALGLAIRTDDRNEMVWVGMQECAVMLRASGIERTDDEEDWETASEEDDEEEEEDEDEEEEEEEDFWNFLGKIRLRRKAT